MERLTKRDSDGRVYPTKLTQHIGEDMDNKLADYEDAEEEGRLLRLPCKIGDTIYEICNTNIVKRSVLGFRVDADSMYFLDIYGISICVGNIGRTVFYTREEAEAKLKELEAENGRTD